MNLKKHINNFTGTSFVGKFFRTVRLLDFLIAGIPLVLLYSDLPAQSLNISNTTVNIPAGSYVITNGSITLQNVGSIDNSGTMQIGAHWTNDANGLINASPGTVVLNGSTNQNVSGTSVTTFNNLTINSTGVLLSNDANVAGILDLTSGIITTGFNTITVAAAVSDNITNASSTSYVDGKLARLYNTTASRSFPIGKSGNYRPLVLDYTALTGTSTVTAEQFESGFPGTAPAGFGQVGTRYWNVTQTGGSSFNYNITLDATGLTFSGSPRILKYDAPVTVALATTIPNYTATGLTTLSDFAFGEVTCTPVGIPSIPTPTSSTICQGSAPTAYTTFASDAISYNWTVTGAGNTIAGTGVTGTVTWDPAFSGTATVSVTATGCDGTSAPASTTVTVYSLSTAPTSVTSDDADNEICSGNSVLLTANGGALGGSPGTSYKWYEGGCGTGSALGSSATLDLNGLSGNPPVPSVGSHTYYVLIEDPCGNTNCASITILVTSAPPGIVTGGFAAPSAACSGTTSLINVTPVGGTNIHYSWNVGTNSSVVLFSTTNGPPWLPGPFNTTTSQVWAQFGALGAGQSGYNVCVQGVNGCGSTANRCVWVRGTVTGPGPITPTAGVACPNTTQAYSCGLSAGATVYTWTLNGAQGPISPNGGNNPTNVTVSFPSGFTSGQLCVTAALSCGGSSTSAPRCINISNNPANPAVPAGTATACPGAMGVPYSVPPVPGASGYTWTVPANATIASGLNSPSITVNFPTPYTGSSSVCVTATSACGVSAVKCKNVVSGTPNQPAGITGPLTNVCGSIVQYSVVSPIGGLTYTWTNPAGTTLAGQGNSTIQLTVSSGFTSGILTVTASSALCAPATSAPRSSSTIWGRPNNAGAITQNPPGPFCSGFGLNFSVVIPPTGPLPTYTWTSSNGIITAGQGTNNIDVTWGTNAPGTITVKAGNTCGLSAGTNSQIFTPANCREEGINTSSATVFTIYPNPAHDKITVSIDVNEKAGFTLQLTDVSGRVVLSQSVTVTTGLNTYDLDLTHLSKGIYMLDVKSSQNNWKTKVVVE
jgi:hypothetical protein